MVPGSKPTTTQLWILSLNHLTTCSSPSVRWVRQVRYVRHSQNILTFFHRYCWEVSWWGSWRNFLPLSTWSTMKTFFDRKPFNEKVNLKICVPKVSYLCNSFYVLLSFSLLIFLSFYFSLSLLQWRHFWQKTIQWESHAEDHILCSVFMVNLG